MSLSNTLKSAVVATGLAAGAAAPEANADVVLDFQITTTASSIAALPVGSVFTVRGIWDETTPDSSPSTLTGRFFDAAVYSFSFDAYTAQVGGGFTQVFDGLSEDRFTIFTDEFSTSPNWTLTDFGMNLSSETNTIFDSDMLAPALDPVKLMQFDNRFFSMFGQIGGESVGMNGEVTNITVVPAPGALVLGGAGLALAGLATGRRRNAEASFAPSGPSQG